MLNRALGTISLLALLLLPSLYAARDRFLSPIPAAQTAEEHRADLGLLFGGLRSEYLIEGQGAPRQDYGECQHQLPLFEKTLTDQGLKSIESVTCVPVDGDSESYAPTFRATSPVDIAVKSVTGARYNSRSLCDVAAEELRTELARTKPVLEASCGPIHGTSGSAESSVDTEPLYQPMAVYLTSNDVNQPRSYSAIEVLVESTSAATKRHLDASADAEAQPEAPADAAAN